MTRTRYSRRPSRSKDGLTWRDFLTAEEKRLIDAWEDVLLGSTAPLSFKDLPQDVQDLREAAASRLTRHRRGIPWQLENKDKFRNRAKLNWKKVREIRASPDKYSALAERYGISVKTVQKIRSNTIWVETPGMKYWRSDYLRGKRSYQTRLKTAAILRDKDGQFISARQAKRIGLLDDQQDAA